MTKHPEQARIRSLRCENHRTVIRFRELGFLSKTFNHGRQNGNCPSNIRCSQFIKQSSMWRFSYLFITHATYPNKLPLCPWNPTYILQWESFKWRSWVLDSYRSAVERVHAHRIGRNTLLTLSTEPTKQFSEEMPHRVALVRLSTQHKPSMKPMFQRKDYLHATSTSSSKDITDDSRQNIFTTLKISNFVRMLNPIVPRLRDSLWRVSGK